MKINFVLIFVLLLSIDGKPSKTIKTPFPPIEKTNCIGSDFSWHLGSLNPWKTKIPPCDTTLHQRKTNSRRTKTCIWKTKLRWISGDFSFKGENPCFKKKLSLKKVFFYKTKRFKNTKRFGCVKRHGKNGNDVRIETYAKVKSEVFAQLETNFLCILKRENKTNITLNSFVSS